jgi:hypothetical protein
MKNMLPFVQMFNLNVYGSGNSLVRKSINYEKILQFFTH